MVFAPLRSGTAPTLWKPPVDGDEAEALNGHPPGLPDVSPDSNCIATSDEAEPGKRVCVRRVASASLTVDGDKMSGIVQPQGGGGGAGGRGGGQGDGQGNTPWNAVRQPG
jgi:hypothetical protein